MSRNPPWTRDELILALELYFQFSGNSLPDHNHPKVIELSILLNKLPFYNRTGTNETFRNSNGVSMKLFNFLRLDPSYPGKGLDAGSKLDKEVWTDFYEKQDDLKKIAQAIRSNFSSLHIEHFSEDDEYEVTEGRILLRVHRSRERDASIVDKKKKIFFAKTGSLACEVCDFDFYQFYGEAGRGFAECHHIVPLSEISPGVKTKLDDLAIVCANCHRMFHRIKPMPSIDELRQTITLNRGKFYAN